MVKQSEEVSAARQTHVKMCWTGDLASEEKCADALNVPKDEGLLESMLDADNLQENVGFNGT